MPLQIIRIVEKLLLLLMMTTRFHRKVIGKALIGMHQSRTTNGVSKTLADANGRADLTAERPREERLTVGVLRRRNIQ